VPRPRHRGTPSRLSPVIRCLHAAFDGRRIKAIAESWNLFRIGRRSGDEDQLTEMLAWLATAVPDVRGALFELAFNEHADGGEIVVTTQHAIAGVGRLDALLEGGGRRLIVESKLGTDYGKDQIRRYLRWLARRERSTTRAALMTLTARSAAWLEDDLQLAADAGITAAERRWEDLSRLLERLAASDESDSLDARMVREFLEMLADEGLVPIRPLAATELGTGWADAWRIVRRYREFFHACKDAVAEALGAVALSNSWSDRGDWFWQDHRLPDGSRVVVGFLNTDEYEKIVQHSRTPILWTGVLAEGREDWAQLREALWAARPAGWSKGNVWYRRPTMWRPLGEAIRGESFEEQRDSLADSAREIRAWYDDGLVRTAAAHAS
jgi:hypothetical protein